MPHITIEYVIMIPILLMQIFLFPLAASWLMNIWVDSRRNLALQDATSHLGSTIQQLYFSLNHETISAGTATCKPEIPPFIEDRHYEGYSVLKNISDSQNGSSRILELTLILARTPNQVTSSVTLGPNVIWKESTFMSNSTEACVSAQKFPNGTICLYFGV